ALKGEEKIAAVVDYYGGLPAEIRRFPFARIASMPPTLILHGEKDEIVPGQEARDLEKLLKKNKRLCTMKLYPAQGHIFQGKDEWDSARRCVAFLKEHLGHKEDAAGRKP